MTNEERWFLVFGGRIYSEVHPYETRDAALEAVEARNRNYPGFSCLRIPYRMTVCEGCHSHLLNCIDDVNARHLTEIKWQECPDHEYWGQNEQTPLIASWVYDY